MQLRTKRIEEAKTLIKDKARPTLFFFFLNLQPLKNRSSAGCTPFALDQGPGSLTGASYTPNSEYFLLLTGSELLICASIFQSMCLHWLRVISSECTT